MSRDGERYNVTSLLSGSPRLGPSASLDKLVPEFFRVDSAADDQRSGVCSASALIASDAWGLPSSQQLFPATPIVEKKERAFGDYVHPSEASTDMVHQ
jgi:hypothetical protein